MLSGSTAVIEDTGKRGLIAGGNGTVAGEFGNIPEGMFSPIRLTGLKPGAGKLVPSGGPEGRVPPWPFQLPEAACSLGSRAPRRRTDPGLSDQ